MAEITDYLQELNEQAVQEESEIFVVRNKTVDALCKRYEKWLAKIEKEASDPNTDYYISDYDYAVNAVKRSVYSAKDITAFSIRLKEYEQLEWFNETGLFLSALINKSQEKNFEIFTKHLKGEVYYICERFEKGNVRVFGNAPCSANRMSGGSLTIFGNAKIAGVGMTGGKLIVVGNLEGGGPFHGGEVHIKGKKSNIKVPKQSKARIYYKERRIR